MVGEPVSAIVEGERVGILVGKGIGIFVGPEAEEGVRVGKEMWVGLPLVGMRLGCWFGGRVDGWVGF